MDDTTRNPETDSFEYIHVILEALNKMGRLDLAVDRMEQRLPIELFAVVERTTQEVDLRHPAHLRVSGTQNGNKPAVNLGNSGEQAEVLRDLLYTLYSKFEAIAEGHRAVHEVIAGIVAREGLRKPDSLLDGFKELWKLYQSEVCTPEHTYISLLMTNHIRCDLCFMTTWQLMGIHSIIRREFRLSTIMSSIGLSGIRTR